MKSEDVILDVYGCVIRIRAEECPGLTEGIRQKFGAFLASNNQLVGADLTISRGSENWRLRLQGRNADLPFGLEWPNIDSVITTLIVHGLQDRVFVHSSCVATPSGAALFVGASTSGKSTLGAALAMKGLQHFSDDLTPISLKSLEVSPYPTSINLRPHSRKMFAVGGSALETISRPSSPLALRWIFFLDMEDVNGESNGVRMTQVDDALDRWDALFSFCTGLERSGNSARVSALPIRDPAFFSRSPQLESAEVILSLKQLTNHIHPPHPPLKTLLGPLSQLLTSADLYTLRVGELNETVDAVLQLIDPAC